MKKQMKKYRVSLPLKKGKLVAAETFEQAVNACLPERELTRTREGNRWVIFETETEMPEKWPKEEEGEGGGNVIDVEYVGDIIVVLPDE